MNLGAKAAMIFLGVLAGGIANFLALRPKSQPEPVEWVHTIPNSDQLIRLDKGSHGFPQCGLVMFWPCWYVVCTNQGGMAIVPHGPCEPNSEEFFQNDVDASQSVMP